MPKSYKLANRTEELEIFLKMASGNYECRIMLIEGPSGIGKTSLLQKFERMCPSDIKYVPFDCKGVNSIAEFLSQVVIDLGPENFRNFEKKVNGFVQGKVDFSENDMAAEKISIAINANVDPDTKNFRLQKLQNSFFEDIALIKHRTVITLDTYQLAIDPLKNWVENRWLRAVKKQLGMVSTVIAGQSIPDSNNVVWGSECDSFLLAPIKEVEAWCKFSNLPEDAVRLATILGEGHPATVRLALSVGAEGWPA